MDYRVFLTLRSLCKEEKEGVVVIYEAVDDYGITHYESNDRIDTLLYIKENNQGVEK